MIKIKKYTKLIFPVICISQLVSCASMSSSHKTHDMAHAQHKVNSVDFSLKENAITQLSNQGSYKVSLYCNESPVPMRKIHSWTVHVETPDGLPVENAKVYVFGGMPMHNHDFHTVPKVKKYLGNGDYLVEGVKFSMLGHWEMRFNIKNNMKEDRVVFKIHM